MRPSTSVSLLAVLLLTATVSRDLAAAPTRPAPATDNREEAPPWVVAGEWMPTEEEAVQDALKKSQTNLVEYLRAQNPPMSWVPEVVYIREHLWTDLGAGETKFKALEWKHAREAAIVWLSDQSWTEFVHAGMPPVVVDKLKGLNRKTFATREECLETMKTVLDREKMERYWPLVFKQANGNAHIVQLESQELKAIPGTMYRAAVRVEVSPFVRPDFDTQERQFQESLRQHRAEHRQKILACVLVGLVALLLAVAGYLRLEDATKGYYTTLLRAAAVAFVALVAAGIIFLGRWLR